MSVHERLDERDLRYFKFVFGRAKGSEDEEIVKELTDPDIDSPQVLYRHLARDGFPVCRMCGASHVEEGHCEASANKKRRARGSGGEKSELRPVDAAAELFRQALMNLEHDIAEVRRWRLYIQDERFVVERRLSGEAGDSYNTYHRGDTPEPLWQEFCEKHGADSSLDSFTVWEDRVVSGGVSWAPPEPLTRLIAVCILAGVPPELLLRALHDNPEVVDTERLEAHIYGKKVGKETILGLVGKAKQVARLVGGATWRSGVPASDLSRIEEEAAAYIQFQRSNGVPDEKILEQLRAGFGFSKPVGLFADTEERAWPDMKMDDLKRLGKFRLPSAFSGGDADI